MDTCYIHAGIPGSHVCGDCGEPICETCRVKDREQALCYLCLTRAEMPEETIARSPSGLDTAFPDVWQPGWRGDAAALFRGSVLGLVATCVVGLLWGLWESFWGRTTFYSWGLVGVPVGLAIFLGTGERHGWVPISIGTLNGLLLVFIRTATIAYHGAATDAEVRSTFRAMAAWEQAGVVVIATVRSLLHNRDLWFLILVCLFITAGVATGGQLRRKASGPFST
jgi:hypothetical protein